MMITENNKMTPHTSNLRMAIICALADFQFTKEELVQAMDEAKVKLLNRARTKCP
jgi:hypothetical protein